MKAAVILCTLATICSFSIGDAANNAGTAALTRLKSDTQSTKNDITRYGNNLVFNLRTKLSNLKIAEITNVNSITNSALKSIQSEIDEAKANGKDADHCYEPSRQRIRQAVLASWKAQDQCTDDGLATVNPVKSNIDALGLQGNKIVNDLDAIAINCISSNSMATQNCIIAKIPEASATVQSYKNTANQVKSTGDSVASSAQISTQSCLQGTGRNVLQESNGARSDAHQCVVNA